MIIRNNHLIASEGKYLRRIATGEIVGTEIFLGYSHFIGGVRQIPPHLDVPEDFEEIDIPEDSEEPDIELTAEEALSIILGNDN